MFPDHRFCTVREEALIIVHMTNQRILGAVLAGGQSRRFGSDKALAELDGESLIARAAKVLGAWCDGVVIVGRSEGPAVCVPDWPAPGMGPLAGLAGALRHARDHGYDSVLSIGVDSPLLPPDLPQVLGAAPAFLIQQPVIGHWPASAFAAAEAILRGDGRHSMRALAEATDAREVVLPEEPANVNFPADLRALSSGSD